MTHFKTLKQKNDYLNNKRYTRALKERLNYLKDEYGISPEHSCLEAKVDIKFQMIKNLDKALDEADKVSTQKDALAVFEQLENYKYFGVVGEGSRWVRIEARETYGDYSTEELQSEVTGLHKQIKDLKEQILDAQDEVKNAKANLESHKNYHHISVEDDKDEFLKREAVDYAHANRILHGAYALLGRKDILCTISEAFDAVAIYNAGQSASKTPEYLEPTPQVLASISGATRDDARVWCAENKRAIGYQYRDLDMSRGHNQKNKNKVAKLVERVKEVAKDNFYELHAQVHQASQPKSHITRETTKKRKPSLSLVGLG